MEALAAEGAFRAPRLEDIERSIELALTDAIRIAAGSSSISGTSQRFCGLRALFRRRGAPAFTRSISNSA